MDIRERNRLIAVTSFFIGVIMIIYLIPQFILFSRYNLSQVFLNPYFYIFLHLLFLTITLFFYSYFMLRPVKTLKARKTLAIGVTCIGGVLLAFPLIGIGLMVPSLPYVLSEGGFIVFWLMGLIPLLAVLIPGILLFMHGWYLRKNLRSETIS